MASIIVTTGRNEGNFYPLGRRTNVIGRAEALPIQILDDLVSRRHLQIRFNPEDEKYYAFDMKSRHGVFINGSKISEETALTEGDEIFIGQTKLLFTDQDFDDKQSALQHYKKIGERMRPTLYEPNQ